MNIPVLPDGPSHRFIGLKASSSKWRNVVFNGVMSLAGIFIVFLVLVDAFPNNWAFNDFMGNAYRFLSPIATVSSADDLSTIYSFENDYGLYDCSRIGIWMVNHTITSFVTKNSDYYVLWGGYFRATTNTNLCSLFSGNYTVDITQPVFLGTMLDTVTFVRGNSVSHLFTSDSTENLATASMMIDEIIALGYTPARRAVDMRFSEEVTILNTTTRQSRLVPAYKIFSKSYCSGCNPIAELGFGTCNLSMVYNPRTQLLTVKSSNVVGSEYQLAVLVAHTAFGTASHYIKAIAIVFALGGFLASRRTVQWKEVDLHNADSILSKVIQTFSPKCFPYPSKSLRFDMFCYNSDIFVFLFAGGVLLDMQNCLLYIRHLDMYNSQTPSLSYTLQLYALTTRLLWFNCALLKTFKIIWNLISSATCTGESKVMAFFNLTNVASLYLSAVMLTYVPSYIEYSNSVRFDQSQQDESLDAIFIDTFDSYYLRTTPSIVIGIVANILFITMLDQLWNHRKWSLLAKNSLGRQALFNSSSILCDYLDDVEKEIDGDRVVAVIHCKARRICTLQWFLSNHLICFGLPEKELRMKKRLLQSSVSTIAPNSSNTTIRDDSQDSKYTIAQDSDHHIHLLDSQVVDVTSLVLNIKVLKDTVVAIY